MNGLVSCMPFPLWLGLGSDIFLQKARRQTCRDGYLLYVFAEEYAAGTDLVLEF